MTKCVYDSMKMGCYKGCTVYARFPQNPNDAQVLTIKVSGMLKVKMSNMMPEYWKQLCLRTLKCESKDQALIKTDQNVSKTTRKLLPFSHTGLTNLHCGLVCNHFLKVCLVRQCPPDGAISLITVF